MGDEFTERRQQLIEAGHFLFKRGWLPAASGNFSVRLGDNRLAVTVSGRDKGRLSVDDILLADAEGRSLDQRRASTETPLHVQIYRRFPDARCVVHPHSVNAILLSLLLQRELVLQDYELLKGLPGIDRRECSISLPIFRNQQDLQQVTSEVDAWLDNHAGPCLGYLIGGRGFYTWGRSVDDALRQVEAFEFLFDCEIKLRGISP